MQHDQYACVLEDGAHPQRGGSVRHRPGNSILLLVRLSPRDARRRHRRATQHAAPHGTGGRVAHSTRGRFPSGERRSVDDPPRLAFAESLVHSGMVAVRLHGACWLPVVWIQIQQMREAKGVASIAALSEQFHGRFRVWIALGVGAFAAVIAIYFLMVAKLLSVSGV